MAVNTTNINISILFTFSLQNYKKNEVKKSDLKISFDMPTCQRTSFDSITLLQQSFIYVLGTGLPAITMHRPSYTISQSTAGLKN